MKPLTPEEFVPMWMENHRVGPGACSDHDIVKMLKDFMSDVDSPVRMLVDKIYQDPLIPEHPTLLAGLSGSPQQAFRHGFYSIRDTEEFQRVAKLTKLS
jgi:hypothetical protein